MTMTARVFSSLAPCDFENGDVAYEIYAAMKDGERMRAIVESLAEKYEVTGHPCCPLCDGCADEPPGHDDECDFGKFLAERKKKEEVVR